MKLRLCLVLLVLAAAPLAGCLDGDENLDETASPGADADEDDGSDASEDGGNQTSPDEDEDTAGSDTNETDAGTEEETGGSQAVENAPTAVVAHVDTGVNPYHEAFRDDSELAYTHPSEYIEGFPEDAPALNLSLEANTYEEALEQDADVWANVTEGELYWIPGTRIVGAISLEAGGTREGVEETRILDDHGHGTMTASRAVGQGTSLAPDARLVTVEGLGAQSVRWAAEEGWIDVQTNSWVDFVPPPANRAQDEAPEVGVESTSEAFAHASDRMVTIAASGNGAAYTLGFAPTPTYALSTAPDQVLLVGGHDNGYLAPWSGSPPHLVADGFRPMAAVFDSTSEIAAHSYSCCTSAAAPYAAGGAAHIVSQARSLLGDTSVGIEEGVVAEGAKDQVPKGPLADGEFTRTELRDVLLNTAQHPPLPTYHDGETHWAAESGEDTPQDPTQPGDNAYCPGCWTAPVTFEEIPEDVPTYPYTGYGAINLFSDQDALAVLAGASELPQREQADQFYEADQTVRETYYPPTGP